MIALIDYGAGNLRSVQNALAALNTTCVIATDPDGLANAEAIIFPGVGAAAPAMAALRKRAMDQAIVEAINRGIPFLGICLGLQLLFESSAEDGAACLGVFKGSVQRLGTTEKLPHIGWNTLEVVRPHPVLHGLEGAAVYFVHSYIAVPEDPSLVTAVTTYGAPFASAIAHGRLVGVQFHPERSGPAGLRLLTGFLEFVKGEVPLAPQAHHPVP